MNHDTWAIVLAAGEGRRIREHTRNAQGIPVPKQFCTFGRPTCMLEWSHRRANRVVSSNRILTVVAAEHREHWEPLFDASGLEAIVQPHNRGTAAGVLLPLLHVLDRAPDAVVTLLPSDHYVRHEGILQRSLEQAVEAARGPDEALVLLGIEPEAPDTEYGWIVPGEPVRRGVRRVVRFAEKPCARDAIALHADGALWNSFMMVGRARTVLRLFARTLPGLLRDMRNAFDRGERGIEAVYETLVARDFSRDVLTSSTEKLRVLEVSSCGWTDLGTPQRLHAFLGPSLLSA